MNLFFHLIILLVFTTTSSSFPFGYLSNGSHELAIGIEKIDKSKIIILPHCEYKLSLYGNLRIKWTYCLKLSTCGGE